MSRRTGGVGGPGVGVGGVGGAGGVEEQRVAAVRGTASRPGNTTCAECGQRGPTYVDVSLGTFVCSRCSGLLRGLTPPHRVKSISMATFTAEEISLIKSKGNDYCRSVYMGLYEGEQPVFKDEQSLKDFLSDKYEKKRYYLDPEMNERLKAFKEIPPIVVQSNVGIWNSTTTARPVAKTYNPANRLGTPVINIPMPVTSNLISPVDNQTTQFSKFPVDFSNADIFNSSQLNNNTMAPSPPTQNIQNAFANFNTVNANSVSQDRYAALADLDFTLRQQNQTQSVDNDTKPVHSFNPFQGSSYTSDNRNNPFLSNTQNANNNVNGNVHYYSNPFMMGPNMPPSGQSKNPFL